MSTLTFPGIIGYWAYPYSANWAWALPQLGTHLSWADCQLVMVTTANDDLLLDCLVPPSTAERRGSQACVPMTLRAHQLPQYQSFSDVLRTLERSVGSEVFVDIEVNGGAGTDLVRITAAGSFVTLELVGAT